MIVSETWPLVRYLAKNLRYQTANEILGEEIPIDTPELLVDTVCTWADSIWPGCKLTEPYSDLKRRQNIFKKYGFVDYYFTSIGTPPIEVSTGGVPLLRDLGFTDPLGDIDDTEISFLNDMKAEACADTISFLLFLGRPKSLATGSPRPLEAAPSEKDFPITLTVLDACLTNSDSVWINKHFYW